MKPQILNVISSHINKIRDTVIKLGSRDSFQDLEFRPEQQLLSYYIVQLANSYHLQNVSEWF